MAGPGALRLLVAVAALAALAAALAGSAAAWTESGGERRLESTVEVFRGEVIPSLSSGALGAVYEDGGDDLGGFAPALVEERAGAEVVFSGLLCGCQVTTTVVQGEATVNVTVQAECQANAGYTDPFRCVCHDVVVACVPGATRAVNSTAFQAASSEHCSGITTLAMPEAGTGACVDKSGFSEPLCNGAAGAEVLVGYSISTTNITRGVPKPLTRTTCRTDTVRNPCTANTTCKTDPVDCVVEPGVFGACSRSCGGGTQLAPLVVVTPAANGGKACPTTMTASRACNEQPCPVDCRMSNFSDWGACSASCGGGTHSRSRTVLTPDSNGGLPCGPLVETAECNTAACAPEDCLYSAFGACSACSVSCGGGTCTANRTVSRPAQHGGAPCEDAKLSEQRPCNMQACPVDCKVSEFSAWSECSASCGSGTRHRERTVLVPASGGGVACPTVLTESEACNTHGCPVDCQVGEFGNWSACRGECGEGVRDRTRAVVVFPENGGAACPSLVDVGTCETGVPCVPVCKLSDWSAWSDCSVSCGGGARHRTRSLLESPSADANCGQLNETEPCNVNDCPVDCHWTEFTEFSPCSASCGGGLQTRTRHQSPPASGGGKPCEGEATETRECNAQSCSPADAAVNCAVSELSAPTPCSVSCGNGTHTRTRTIVVEPKNGGTECPPLTVTEVCVMPACPDPNAPVACAMSEFGNWSECSASCGNGTQSRSRTIVTEPKNGGAECPPLTESRECSHGACPDPNAPVACVMSEFGNWSECSASCGGGTQTRSRTIVTEPKNGGAECTGVTQTQPCNTAACPGVKVDCQVGEFGNWSDCSASCGGGTRHRSRVVTVAAANGGAECPALAENETCNADPCVVPVPCVMSEFGNWSECSASCGGGTQTRSRTIITEPKDGGAECTGLTQTQPCNTAACPGVKVDCQVGEFGNWSSCSVSCGGGTRHRSRVVTVAAANGGAECPALAENETCNADPCVVPVPCVMSEFGNWSECSASCGGGTQTRSRTIITEPKDGGAECTGLTQTQPCNTAACVAKVDCQVGDWSAWSSCSVSCGGGSRRRARLVTVPAANGGAPCPPLSEDETCGTDACPPPPPAPNGTCPCACPVPHPPPVPCGCSHQCASAPAVSGVPARVVQGSSGPSGDVVKTTTLVSGSGSAAACTAPGCASLPPNTPKYDVPVVYDN